ncbi:MAG: 8-oxoguanine DNA glycosylase [Lachnospiraceae bacterium]|nr:8-oxoguanine DNA glycosylase [Lachnospiraceae bacterium]
MMQVTIDNLDLSQIADSGQCFRWNRLDEGVYEVIAFDRYLKIRQRGNKFNLSCDEAEWNDIWAAYLDTDTYYAEIGRIITDSEDEYLKEAYRHGCGIRILRQDLWEVIVSFIISQNNNIKRIRGCIEAICQKAALPLKGDAPFGKYRFPKPDDVDEDFFDDRELGLGYRDEYLSKMYEYARTSDSFPDRLKQLDNKDAFSELKSFTGIGDKVANCICLFGLHHIDAFPIDTHIKQILNAHYPNGFDFERYKGYAGIIQQYMFNYKLNG